MYFIFESSYDELQEEADVAQAVDLPESFHEFVWNRLWRAEPIGPDFPALAFSVNPTTHLLDNHVTDTGDGIYSERLIQLLKETGVKHEAFPVKVVNRATGEVLRVKYYWFHLLEQADAFDRSKSNITPSGKVKGLKISKLFDVANLPIFRDANLPQIVLVRDSLRQLLDKSGITGCSYLDIESYGKQKRA
ncbi:imm11 family protein [Calidithermus chliarophilus]|uniref:imm11 family protein n=1 Tax=Calidithermus chliarophilus TaxID=52023 RepID=UPI00048417D7|nr:hypothetical protein [Calidithermus chliarophilus]